jgi:hypothetical protein
MFVAFMEKDVCKVKNMKNFISSIPKYSLLLCMGVEMGKENCAKPYL